MTLELKRWARGIDDYFFQPADPRVCAWLRIGFGILVTIHFAILALDFELWFGENGVAPYEAARSAVDPDTRTLFTWMPRTGAGLMGCVFLMLAHSVMLTAGVLSRFNAAGVFVWMVSIQHRNHMLFDGEDIFFRLFAFFLVFLPIGACWSVDSWRRAKSGKSMPEVGSGWALRLIQIQLALIYFSTVWLKLDGENWLNGTALWYVFQLNDTFGRIPLPEALTESVDFCRWAGWAVLVVESFLVVGPFFRETRRFAIALGFLLHLSLELTMNLFLFEWLMMLALSSHLRGEEIEAIGRWIRRWCPRGRRRSSEQAGQSVETTL